MASWVRTAKKNRQWQALRTCRRAQQQTDSKFTSRRTIMSSRVAAGDRVRRNSLPGNNDGSVSYIGCSRTRLQMTQHAVGRACVKFEEDVTRPVILTTGRFSDRHDLRHPLGTRAAAVAERDLSQDHQRPQSTLRQVIRGRHRGSSRKTNHTPVCLSSRAGNVNAFAWLTSHVSSRNRSSRMRRLCKQRILDALKSGQQPVENSRTSAADVNEFKARSAGFFY